MVRLSKGIEVEIYTGTSQGKIVGLSDRITKELNGFVKEPDSRNVEYITVPLLYYDDLLYALINPRKHLRKYLRDIGDYTVVPGSTLSLGDNVNRFYRSDPNNSYHSYIENTYGTDVVTASVHINIGIDNPEMLMHAHSLIRVEAPLFLALSASSPFLDGKVTGFHSTRWHMFPQTPQKVPFFMNHAHFIDWTEKQLALQNMQNVRHFWTSVRPNGDKRPYHLNRLELRICDLIIDPVSLLSVVALLEARLLQLMENTESLNPLLKSQLSTEALLYITQQNELEVAKRSLNANLYNWEDGSKIEAKKWIEKIYQEVFPIAKQNGFSCFLNPIKKILQDGNLAQQWLHKYKLGNSITSIVSREIEAIAYQEKTLEEKLFTF
ncbi:glutamate--cysteine ligase [Candidatus Atelocyanobacterium thalassae]|uniref:glutamate--cysteine ligase n=1 Tax=Candidatus Atelocyanobacterium thalassae TaxID=713887 RepID=UPI00387F3BF2